MKRILIPIATVLALSGCVTTADSQPVNNRYKDYVVEHGLESVQKVTAFKYQGWKSLDDRHLVLSTSINRSYLVTLDHFCDGLRNANTIKVNQGMSSRLSTRFDSITVPQSMQSKCTIKEIHVLNKVQNKEINKL